MNKFFALFLLSCVLTANAGNKMLVSQKCFKAIQIINSDARELIKNMNWHFNQTRRHEWAYKPSEIIQDRGTQPTRINEDLQLEHMPATTYVAKFLAPMTQQLDKDFEDKNAEFFGDKQKTWQWFTKHFAQQASKAFAAYKYELVKQDQEEIAAADRQKQEKEE